MRNLVLVLVAATLVLAACGGSRPAARANAAATTGRAIPIVETEFSLSPSTVDVPKPGTYVFKPTNKGTIAHALAVRGHGIDVATKPIRPGGTATLRVNLTKRGSYTLLCPIDGHEGKGMRANLVVGSITGTPTVGITSPPTTRGGY